MYKHPVKINWKNDNLFASAATAFSGVAGSHDGGERAKALITKFVTEGKIFADEPSLGEPTEVTVDLKKVDIPYDVDVRRPLTLTKLNGVATMLLRPDEEKDEGLLFKICPHDGVQLTISEFMDIEVKHFNTSIPISLQQQAQMAEAS